MNIKDIFSNPYSIGAIIALMFSAIQISPLKINPWSMIKNGVIFIGGKIGNVFNSSIIHSMDDIKKDQEEIKNRLDEHIHADDERDMDFRRQRILKFNADIMRGEDFSHEYFCDILVDIDAYEQYCETNRDYHNSRAIMAISNIRRVYEEHEKQKDWTF